MAFEQRSNSGALFRNERKEKELQPTHTGTALIDGKEYFISAWTKQSKSGTRFFSLAFTPKMLGDHGDAQENPSAQPDSDIPF